MKFYGLIICVLIGNRVFAAASDRQRIKTSQDNASTIEGKDPLHFTEYGYNQVESQATDNEEKQIRMPRGRILFKLKPKHRGVRNKRLVQAHRRKASLKNSTHKAKEDSKKNIIGKQPRKSRINFLRKLFGGGGSLASNAPQLNDARIVVHSFAPPPRQQSNVIRTFSGNTSPQVIQTRIRIPANNLPGRINNRRVRV